MKNKKKFAIVITAMFIVSFLLIGCTDKNKEALLPKDEEVKTEYVLPTEKIDNIAKDKIQPTYSPDSPLAYLLGKSVINITTDDIKLLLETPVKELDDYFNITPQDKNKWMMGITAVSPIEGVSFFYGYSEDEPPEYLPELFLWGFEGKGENLPLGYSIDEILKMPQWGETPIDEFLYAGGYSGDGATPLKQLNYSKDGLDFCFRTDYNNVFSSAEKQDEIIELIIVNSSSVSAAETKAPAQTSEKRISKEEAIKELFNSIYKDTIFAEVKLVTDSNIFFGYEYRFIRDEGEISDPWRIEYYDTTRNNEFYIFWLNEQVYYDGKFDHAVTGNFYAVNRITKEIIQQRIFDENGIWDYNEKYPVN